MENTENKLRLVERELSNLRAEYEEFMSAISHDLSAPLRQTGGFAEIILKNNGGNFDEKTKRHFEFITMGAEKGKSIIDALREFSHLGRKNTDFVSFDCQEVVDEVLQSLSAWIEKSGARIDIQGFPNIIGDKEQIRAVFFHLLKNALIYRSPTHKPEIAILCDQHPEFWEFSVSDNGIGVPDNMDKRIFQVLKRAVSADHYPGHGMGLAIAKKIVQRHGGTIKLIRQDSKRTVFAFTISKHPVEI